MLVIDQQVHLKVLNKLPSSSGARPTLGSMLMSGLEHEKEDAGG